MPVYYDTGLGWEADGSSIVLTGGLFGAVSTSTLPIKLPFFNSAPSISQVVAGGASVYFNNVKYWYAFYNTNSHSPDLKTCILVTSQGAGVIMIVSDDFGQSTGRNYGVMITNGSQEWHRANFGERSTTIRDTASGLYYYQTVGFNGVNSTQFPGDGVYASDTVLVGGPTEADALAPFITVPTRFYKYGDGPAASGFVRWINTNGDERVSPFQISTVTEYTNFSYDNQTVASDQVTIGMNKDGLHFDMSFFAQYEGQISDNVTLIYDLTTEFPTGIGIGTVMDRLMELTYIRVLESPDPYTQDGAGSGEAGGGGEELDDDPVEEETLPVPSVAGHGFCTIYVPSSQELNQMSSYLWGGSFDVSQVVKLFSSPMDSILGLSAVPVDLAGSSEQIYLGGVALTGITMPKYTGRTSVKVDFGTVTVSKRWGSYLDYDPYTEFSIYLPFIGIKPIKADDIMGKTVSLMYAIDILSGGCVAYLRPAGGSVLYEWSGQCALQIPVTGRSYDNVFQSAMSVATAAFAAVAAPASAPVLSGAVASAAVQAAATKPHIERSGAVNGITGFLGQLRPYLIRTIPEAFIPTDQNKFIGYPAYINVDLASVTGYNEVDSIHLENVTATGAELDEIETILKGGVIF